MNSNHSVTPINNTTKEKRVLIVMAHGSRKKEANDEFEELVETITQGDLSHAAITHCFLELSQPSLQDVVEEYIAKGYQQFELYPLFFNQGNHVKRDIPNQIERITQQFPNINIHQLHYFGMNPNISSTVIEHIHQQSA